MSTTIRLIWAYLRILVGAITKRGWKPSPGKNLPKAQAHMMASIEPRRLARLCCLAPYPEALSRPWTPAGAITGRPEEEPRDALLPGPVALPALFLLSQAFPCVLECLAALPFPVLGGVMNVRAKHEVVAPAAHVGDKVLHSARVLPATRQTPGGHMEFDITITSMHVLSGHTMYEATLTLVRLSGQKKQRKLPPTPATPTAGPQTAAAPATPPTSPATPTAASTTTTMPAGGVKAAAAHTTTTITPHTIHPEPAPAPAAAPPSEGTATAAKSGVIEKEGGVGTTGAKAVELVGGGISGSKLVESLRLEGRLGRQWAMLDGDVSPMHLSRATARLSGFKGTVANVHCVAAHVEAVMMKHGIIPITSGGSDQPYQLSVLFKRPIILPTHLKVWLLPPTSAAAVAVAAAPAEPLAGMAVTGAGGGAAAAGSRTHVFHVTAVTGSGGEVLVMEGSVRV